VSRGHLSRHAPVRAEYLRCSDQHPACPRGDFTRLHARLAAVGLGALRHDKGCTAYDPPAFAMSITCGSQDEGAAVDVGDEALGEPCLLGLGARGAGQNAIDGSDLPAKRQAADGLPLIGLATVPHVDHKDQHGLVVDAVDHPVVPGAHSPKPWQVVADQHLRRRGTGILG